MRTFRNWPIRFQILSAMVLLILLTGTVYTLILLHERHEALLQKIDARLQSAAHAVPDMLPGGYYDQVDKDSLTDQQFDQIVDRFNKLCLRLDLDYLWSVLAVDRDHIYFTTATSPDKDVANSRHARFFERHNDPAAFHETLDKNQVTFNTFRNQWGAGRQVLIPFQDGRGRTHMIGASVKISELDSMVRGTILEGLAVGLAVMLLGMLICYVLAHSLSTPITRLTRIARRIANGDLNQTIDVRGSLELAGLSESFQTMRDAIRAQMKSLRDSQENLAITLNSIGDAVIATDAAGGIVRMNPVAEELTGWAGSEANGKPLGEVFRIYNAQTRQVAEDPVARVLSSGQVVGLANDTILLSREGKERQIADSGAPIRNAENEIVGVVLVFRDVTDEYRTQDQLRQAQKMEALGQLAGGIAHDFRNQLTVINGYCELILQDLPAQNPLREPIEEIRRAAASSTSLTGQLLAFSRKQVLRPEAVDLNLELRQLSGPLSRMIGEDIDLHLELGQDLPPVETDRTQVQQAIMNLAVNARDAMPQGGSLTLRTVLIPCDERLLREHPDAAGQYVCVSVRDTGSGMDPETLRRVFDPFFTTKEVNKGTGLGLSMVYGFVKQSGGLIDIDSQCGQGTTVRIFLPRSDGRPAGKPAETSLTCGGNETLLVVEDEPHVRGLTVRALRSYGYSVLETGDVNEALAISGNAGIRVDLLISDVVMPVLYGPQLAQRLRETRPGLKVLFVSGYTRDTVASHGVLEPGIRLLMKPFSPAELAQAVRDALDE